MEPTNSEVQDMVEKFTGMLSHIRDTFINASTLAESVRALQGQVESLQRNVEHYSSQVATLDEALTRTRQERDDANATLAQERVAHNQLTHEHESLKSDHDNLWNEHTKTVDTLESLKRERDEAFGEARRLQEENDALKQRVDAINKVLNPQPVEQPREDTGRFASGSSW